MNTITNGPERGRMTVNPEYKNFVTKAVATLANRADVKLAPGTRAAEKIDGAISFLGALILCIPAAPAAGYQTLVNTIRASAKDGK